MASTIYIARHNVLDSCRKHQSCCRIPNAVVINHPVALFETSVMGFYDLSLPELLAGRSPKMILLVELGVTIP